MQRSSIRQPLLQGLLTLASVCLIATLASAAEWYVATDGLDVNSGGLESPFGTFDRAIAAASPGDAIWVRGGTYELNSRIRIQKGGVEGAPIRMWAFPGETPILDFDSNPSTSDRGIQLERDWWHFQGLTIQNAPDNGIWASGSYNVFEQLVLRWNGDSGLQLSGNSSQQPSYNQILNTDSYENYDPLNHGENADGFAAKFRDLGPGNLFSGNRAWGNSDDGWDFWEAAGGVIVENSWSFKNGFNIWNDSSFQGDGNGIKLGRDSGPHRLSRMLVWGNVANGVDVNGNATVLNAALNPVDHGVAVYNVTAYDNGNRNFRFDEAFPHDVRNNVSYDGSVTIDGAASDDYNSWNSGALAANAADFLSLDDSGAKGPRQADGSLPTLDFLRLASDSHLIDAGTDVGLPFIGAAPDLGALESGKLFSAADFNSDFAVDEVDLAVWEENLGVAGVSRNDGDANGDGVVDGLDLLVWQGEFFAAPPGVVQAVPEPVAALLVWMAAVAAGARSSWPGSLARLRSRRGEGARAARTRREPLPQKGAKVAQTHQSRFAACTS